MQYLNLFNESGFPFASVPMEPEMAEELISDESKLEQFLETNALGEFVDGISATESKAWELPLNGDLYMQSYMHNGKCIAHMYKARGLVNKPEGKYVARLCNGATIASNSLAGMASTIMQLGPNLSLL